MHLKKKGKEKSRSVVSLWAFLPTPQFKSRLLETEYSQGLSSCKWHLLSKLGLEKYTQGKRKRDRLSGSLFQPGKFTHPHYKRKSAESQEIIPPSISFLTNANERSQEEPPVPRQVGHHHWVCTPVYFGGQTARGTFYPTGMGVTGISHSGDSTRGHNAKRTRLSTWCHTLPTGCTPGYTSTEKDVYPNSPCCIIEKRKNMEAPIMSWTWLHPGDAMRSYKHMFLSHRSEWIFELQGWVQLNEGMHTVGDKDLTTEPFIVELDHLKQMDLFKKEEQTQN